MTSPEDTVLKHVLETVQNSSQDSLEGSFAHLFAERLSPRRGRKRVASPGELSKVVDRMLKASGDTHFFQTAQETMDLELKDRIYHMCDYLAQTIQFNRQENLVMVHKVNGLADGEMVGILTTTYNDFPASRKFSAVDTTVIYPTAKGSKRGAYNVFTLRHIFGRNSSVTVEAGFLPNFSSTGTKSLLIGISEVHM